MIARALITVAPLLAFAGSAAAAPTYIHAGRLIAEPGKAVRGASTIIVDGGRIVAVQDGYVAAPAGAATIDLKSRTVLPGLIDSHVHLASDRGGEAGLIAFMREEPQMNALEAQMNGMKTLRAGFTTVRNLGDDGATLALREAIKRGWVQGPRIVDAASSISTTGGHMDGRGGLNDDLVAHLPAPENLCDSVETCRKVVRRQIDRGADVIKFATTGGVNSGTGLATRMFEDEARALVETAHAYGRKVAVHAHGADGIKLALRAGADSIEHGTVMDDEIIRTMKKQGTYYVPTLSTVNGYLERLAANPNAYAPDFKKQIDWRIGITGQSVLKAY
ncbi:MAG: amidohydrolase family protein, partial [Sphingomicrobium sp.]